MNNATYFLNQAQYDWLAACLPQPQSTTGRPSVPNNELLNGILFVLKTGCRWRDIPTSVCSRDYSSCWRRLHYWHKWGSLLASWDQVLRLLHRNQRIDLSVGNLDGSVVQSPRFRDGTGYSGKHRRFGTNVSLLTDRLGIPLVLATSAGNNHDLRVGEQVLLHLRGRTRTDLETLNADKGYDSNAFRNLVEGWQLEPNIPPRQYQKRKRSTLPYDPEKGRFRVFVEHTFAWLKYYRRLRYRWERHAHMFQAFVMLGCILICLRKV